MDVINCRTQSRFMIDLKDFRNVFSDCQLNLIKKIESWCHTLVPNMQVEILPSLVNVTSEDIPCTGEYFIKGKSKVWIGVSRANGSKCERCWNFSPQVGEYRDHLSLCGRCHGIISQPLPSMAAAS